MTEENTEELVEFSEEELAIKEETIKEYFAQIMEQLLQCERFQRFFKINFDVQTFVDHESGTYNTRLIELPPELAAVRLREMAASHAADNMPKVELATMDEIEKISKETKGNGR